MRMWLMFVLISSALTGAVPFADACETDADCQSACATCIDGDCVDGAVECEGGLDCPQGEYCQFDDQDTCLNSCQPLDEGFCVRDEDCSKWEDMGNGFCVPGSDFGPEGTGDCFYSFDCYDDSECGICETCTVDGCQPTWTGECSTDDECGEGETCFLDADNGCVASCISDDEPGDAVDVSTSPGDTVEGGSEDVGTEEEAGTQAEGSAGGCSLSTLGSSSTSPSIILLSLALLASVALLRRRCRS